MVKWVSRSTAEIMRIPSDNRSLLAESGIEQDAGSTSGPTESNYFFFKVYLFLFFSLLVK